MRDTLELRQAGTKAKRPARPDIERTISKALEQVLEVSTAVDTESDLLMQTWKPVIAREGFLPGARNLAGYLALRRQDNSKLQGLLSEIGLSSMGRSEARVHDSLLAVRATLSKLANVAEVSHPEKGWTRRGADFLRTNTEQIFGRDPTGPRTRIMVTLPTEAADDPELMRRLIESGADCMRINCAHDDAQIWARAAASARKVARKLGRECRILMDLGGPKFRISAVTDSEQKVRIGDVVHMVAGSKRLSDESGVAFSTTSSEAYGKLVEGHRVWINDGKLGLVVERVSAKRLRLRATHVGPKGARIRIGKGINFPDAELDAPALTKKDLRDLDDVIQIADIVGLSFVQRPSAVVWLQEEMRKRLGQRPLPALVLKIETALAVRNLPRLLVQSAGQQPTAVMVARGDLAVELGLDRLSEIQEQILWLCEAAHVPVVWATQVLEGLVRKGMPSRPETSDAALGQRAECVMLNKGPHLVEAVRFLDNILHRMDRHVLKKSPVLGGLNSWSDLAALGNVENPVIAAPAPGSKRRSKRSNAT